MGREKGIAVRRLLIVKLSSIGDIAHALPVVSLIKRSIPGIVIDWAVRRRCATLLEGNPDIDNLYVIDDRPSLMQLWRLGVVLRRRKYDTAFDMQGLALSGAITLLSGATRRIGLNRNREANKLFLTDASVEGRVEDMHAVDIQYGFAEALGIAAPRGEAAVQQYLADADAAFAASALSGLPRPWVALNVGASTVYKRWPAAYWGDVGRRIAAIGGGIALLGAMSDAADVEAIAADIGSPESVRSLAGKTTLRQLASVIAQCDLLISGDTGPLHIGVDVATPVVALYGPTSPLRTGPYGSRGITIWKNLSCGPCNRHPTCDGRVDCLKLITPDEVFEAAERLLAAESPISMQRDVKTPVAAS